MTIYIQMPSWHFFPNKSKGDNDVYGDRTWILTTYIIDSYSLYLEMRNRFYKKRKSIIRRCLKDPNGIWYQYNVRADDDLAH